MALNLKVKVHPVALFQIADAFERRNADADRVIGTLLGSVDKECVEITNCFCVPHNEVAEEVSVELEFAQAMYDMHKRVNPSEVIVGWWATGLEVTGHSNLIHDYYTRECADAVHLTVDTTLQTGRLGIRAYMGVPMGVPGKTQGAMFYPMPLEICMYEPERVSVRLCQNTKFSRQKQVEISSDLKQICNSTLKVEDMLDTVIKYVDDVLAGTVPPDNNVGRALLSMVHLTPKMSDEEFDEMINSNLKDLLMVLYLSHLNKTQLSLNEKLGTINLQ